MGLPFLALREGTQLVAVRSQGASHRKKIMPRDGREQALQLVMSPSCARSEYLPRPIAARVHTPRARLESSNKCGYFWPICEVERALTAVDREGSRSGIRSTRARRPMPEGAARADTTK